MISLTILNKGVTKAYTYQSQREKEKKYSRIYLETIIHKWTSKSRPTRTSGM